MKRRKFVAAYSFEEFNLSADNTMEAPEVVSKDTPAVENIIHEDAVENFVEDVVIPMDEAVLLK